jgi:energy-coupling factor transport system substrate-specific component
MERTHALPLRLRTTIVLGVVSVIGLMMFAWPLVVDEDAELAHSADAPLVFAVVLAMLIFVLAGEVTSGRLDAKALAMLGVLSATAAALRPLGAGMSGFQPMFVILILGGRALGPGFGFALGLVSMFGSALLTGGVGPWLPFQMLGAAWLGMGAGLLPRVRGGRAEVAMLAVYGALSGLLYGFLLNMWFWPFLTTVDAAVSFVPGDSLTGNLGRFVVFCLITSLGFDIPRALGSVILIAVLGGPTLRAIRRTTARANFVAAPQFVAPPTNPPAPITPPGRS